MVLRVWFAFTKSLSTSVRAESKYVFSLFTSRTIMQQPQEAWSTVHAEHNGA